MKRAHRRSHAIVWLLLVPILLFTVFWADRQRLDPPPAMDEAVDASAAGVLP